MLNTTDMLATVDSRGKLLSVLKHDVQSRRSRFTFVPYSNYRSSLNTRDSLHGSIATMKADDAELQNVNSLHKDELLNFFQMKDQPSIKIEKKDEEE